MDKDDYFNFVFPVEYSDPIILEWAKKVGVETVKERIELVEKRFQMIHLFLVNKLKEVLAAMVYDPRNIDTKIKYDKTTDLYWIGDIPVELYQVVFEEENVVSVHFKRLFTEEPYCRRVKIHEHEFNRTLIGHTVGGDVEINVHKHGKNLVYVTVDGKGAVVVPMFDKNQFGGNHWILECLQQREKLLHLEDS